MRAATYMGIGGVLVRCGAGAQPLGRDGPGTGRPTSLVSRGVSNGPGADLLDVMGHGGFSLFGISGRKCVQD